MKGSEVMGLIRVPCISILSVTSIGEVTSARPREHFEGELLFPARW